MDIRIDPLHNPQILALLHEHLAHMHSQSPPESVHALDVDALRQPDITFWSAWDGDTLLGCGALKALAPRWCRHPDQAEGEIKSMRTKAVHRGQGVAAAIVQTILAQAQARGYYRLNLETGSQDGFAAARRLYARHGFTRCGPFADYTDDPNSVFMTLALR